MEAVQFDPNVYSVSLVTTDIPIINKPEEVIVKVAYAGICGIDIHVIQGECLCSTKPFSPGHEFCGIVHAIGVEVKTLKPGDRVVVDPNSGCGFCKYCHTASYHLCPTGSINSAIGIFCDGGWAQFCKVSARQVYILPSTISFKQATLLEPLSCIYHGHSRISPIDLGRNILILGAGIMGMLWCIFLHHIGHRKVFISEPSKDRRDLMKKLDTGFTITSPDGLKHMFSNDTQSGVDVCIDCSGDGPAIQESFNLLNRGGKICLFRVCTPETNISISPYKVFIKELTMYGSTVNPFSFELAISIMEAMDTRYFDYDHLGINVFRLNQYKEAVEALHQKKISKAVFKVYEESE